MKHSRNVALGWARFQYRLSKPFRLLGFTLIGFAWFGVSIFDYLKGGKTTDLYLALGGLMIGLLALERAGFVYWIDELRDGTKPDESKR